VLHKTALFARCTIVPCLEGIQVASLPAWHAALLYAIHNHVRTMRTTQLRRFQGRKGATACAATAASLLATSQGPEPQQAADSGNRQHPNTPAVAVTHAGRGVNIAERLEREDDEIGLPELVSPGPRSNAIIRLNETLTGRTAPSHPLLSSLDHDDSRNLGVESSRHRAKHTCEGSAGGYGCS
jgi:hypothetical protein